MDVSISIVTYNTKDLVLRCVESIYKYTRDVSFEIIVVDNGSDDGTLQAIREKFPKITLIPNKKNNYFSKANNQVLEKARGEFFLILNSDTCFIDNSIKKMVKFMKQNKGVGACEGVEIYENGKIMQSGSRFSTPLIDFYELSLIGKRIKDKKLIDWYRISHADRRKDFSIDVGCDAFLMVRKKVIDRIKGYDERFLLYYTENDLCARIKKLGFEIVHVGSAKVMHTVSASVKKIGWKKTDIYYHDLLIYYKKNGFPILGTVLFLLLKLEEDLLKIRERLYSQ